MTNSQRATLENRLAQMLDRIERREPIGEDLVEITRLQTEISGSAPAQLNHFLERRSYAKALEFIRQGRVSDDPARPACDDDASHP